MIPNFDYNGVLPPHLGNPTGPQDISPFETTSIKLVERFAYNAKRIEILSGFFEFRK